MNNVFQAIKIGQHFCLRTETIQNRTNICLDHQFRVNNKDFSDGNSIQSEEKEKEQNEISRKRAFTN